MRGLYNKPAKLIGFKKNSGFIFRTFHLLFQENPKFEIFEKFQAKKPIETQSIEILPISAIFKTYRQFLQTNHLLSRKSPAVERFQLSWAIIILFETQARRKMPLLPISEKKDLFKSNIYFSKKTQKFDCFESSEAIWTSDTQSR